MTLARLGCADPCREYTSRRDDKGSKPKAFIRGNAQIGTALEVKITNHLERDGIEIKIDSMCTSVKKLRSWASRKRTRNIQYEEVAFGPEKPVATKQQLQFLPSSSSSPRRRGLHLPQEETPPTGQAELDMASLKDAVMALSGKQVAETQLYLADSTRVPPWIRWRWRLGIQRWHAPWFGRNVAIRVPKKSRLGQWTGSEFRWGWGRRMCDGRFTMRSRRPSVGPGARVLGIRWCPLRAYDCSKTEHCWAVWTLCRSVFLPKGSRKGKTPSLPQRGHVYDTTIGRFFGFDSRALGSFLIPDVQNCPTWLLGKVDPSVWWEVMGLLHAWEDCVTPFPECTRTMTDV